MNSSIAAAGEVTVEGEHLGRIEGFRFVPDATEGQTDQKAVLSAALRALRQDLPARLQAFTNCPDGEIVFDSQLRVCWGGGPVARLLSSGDVLAPKIEAIASDLLDGPAREEVRRRAATWVETRIRLGLSELMDARATTELPAGARGIVFQLCEGLGVLPRRPIEDQLAQLGEEDRKALARLGVRVGVFSLYFPSMLKPVPIRLRAGLWMIAKDREVIPPLPAEGRTSMDLPRDAVRDFYAAIGYMPLGDHAIRADMVERLAAMARHAVRDSREAARRAQQQERKAAAPAAAASSAGPASPASSFPAPASDDEISEWAIVAAAFGESEPTAAVEQTTAPEPVAEIASQAVEENAEAARENAADETAVVEPVVDETESQGPDTVEAAQEGAGEAPTIEEQPADEQPAQEAAQETAKGTARDGAKPQPVQGSRPLPPGWFRATPQMMSLVGCSEPEMAGVLSALGYRVHPPSEENGPLHAFSIKPRFVREREEQRERQRLQQRQQRDQRRRERPERPNERQFFADSPRPERSNRDGPRKDGPRKDGPRQDGPRQDRGKDDRPPREDRPRGPRPPRRDGGGPALRLYATTETKGDATADSPFAKLLELKLGGKK